MTVKRHSSKKAQITLQFNWVFAIIIGAVILSFFVVVIQKQRKSSDLDLANNLLSDMDLILAGQTVSVGREDLMEIPKREIKFDCEEYSIMDMTRQKGNSIIFSPMTFESDRMLAWTLSWDLPFKIGNFIYLTTPDIKYYLVHTGNVDTPMSVGEYIINNFPENLKLREVEFGGMSIIPDDDNQIRMIYLGIAPGSVPPNLISARNQDVSALYIDVDPMDLEAFDRSDLQFYVKDGGLFRKQTHPDIADPYPAFGKESVFGAMFVNDIELYHCTMIRALKRMAIVAHVYNRRATAMQNDPLTPSSCIDYYDEIFDNFIYEDSDESNLGGFQGDVFGAEDYAWTTNRAAILASCSTLY